MTDERPQDVQDVAIPEDGPEFLTVEETASLLKVAATTVRGELSAGRIPGRLIGREWRISRTALIDHFRTAGPNRRARGRRGG